MGSFISCRLIGTEILRFIRAKTPSVGFTSQRSSFSSAAMRSSGVRTCCHQLSSMRFALHRLIQNQPRMELVKGADFHRAVLRSIERGIGRERVNTDRPIARSQRQPVPVFARFPCLAEQRWIICAVSGNQHHMIVARYGCDLAKQLRYRRIQACFEPLYRTRQTPGGLQCALHIWPLDRIHAYDHSGSNSLL